MPSISRSAVNTVDLYPNDDTAIEDGGADRPIARSIVSAVIFPRTHIRIAKTFWQHSGDGISSRRAEYCHKAFEDGRLIVKRTPIEMTNGNPVMSLSKGPRRYQKNDPLDPSVKKQVTSKGTVDGNDCVRFVEERFGRNLDVSLASSAKVAIRRRIAGVLTANVDLNEVAEMSHPPTRTAHVRGFSEKDVYLYPCGMSAIFNTHRTMMACRGRMKSISFG